LSIGIRQRMNENPRATAGVIGAIVVFAIGVVVMQVRASRHMIATQLPDSYFSADDGQTFFTASGDNVPPFDYKGQQAMHAAVFKCNGKLFVGYLERFTPEAHKMMVDGKNTQTAMMNGRELKRPGDKNWVKCTDLKAVNKLIDVRCPDGTGTPEPIEP
jgi:hypothetical protein